MRAAGKDEPHHAIATGNPLWGPEGQVTRCGWEFGYVAGLGRDRSPPEGLRACKTCWPALRAKRHRADRGAPEAGGEMVGFPV